MIVIPINRIEDKVAQQPDITVGRHFIEQLINNNLIPDGICPIITGGAVRDDGPRGADDRLYGLLHHHHAAGAAHPGDGAGHPALRRGRL